MALTILYTITRSDDYKSISITDNNTAWGIGGEPDTGDVTAITLNIYGYSDAINVLKAVSFTAGEITTFTSGGTVTIYSTDSRLFETPYFPDNFYTTYLDVSVSTGETTKTAQAFASSFYVNKAYISQIADVSVPIYTFYEVNKKVVGNLVVKDHLRYLNESVTVARKDKWVKAYEFLKWNFALD